MGVIVAVFDSSHPVRVRGLKREGGLTYKDQVGVAPRAGAWIETLSQSSSLQQLHNVAPRAGAWIETILFWLFCFRLSSHPVRVRGLKHPECSMLHSREKSHPGRVRGLKLGSAGPRPRRRGRTPCGCVD